MADAKIFTSQPDVLSFFVIVDLWHFSQIHSKSHDYIIYTGAT